MEANAVNPSSGYTVHPRRAGYLAKYVIFSAGLVCLIPVLAWAVLSKDDIAKEFQSIYAELHILERQGYDTEALSKKTSDLLAGVLTGRPKVTGENLRSLKLQIAALKISNPERSTPELQRQWLKIYGDILQKLTFLLLTAFLLIRIKPLQEVFIHDPPTGFLKHNWIMAAALTLAGMLTGWIGYFANGEADWAFLDLPMVFTVLCGLICGPLLGALSGLAGCLFRWFIGAHRFSYLLVFVFAGAIGGSFSRFFPKGFLSKRAAISAGLAASLVHGLITYAPLYEIIPWSRWIGLVISITFLEALYVYLFIVFLVSARNDLSRKKIEKLLPEMKLKFLQAQINPHFLFNALNTIAAICSREKEETARDLVVKLSNYFRRILKRTDEWVSLHEEFEYIDSYLEIERARYQKALQIKKEIKLGPKALATEIPVLMLQPIVENAIRHGLAPQAGGGLLELLASENGKMVEIIIKDNGVGIPPERLKVIQYNHETDQQSKSLAESETGIGLRNIQERLKYIYGPSCRFEIVSELGKGTTVILKLPIGYVHEAH